MQEQPRTDLSCLQHPLVYNVMIIILFQRREYVYTAISSNHFISHFGTREKITFENTKNVILIRSYALLKPFKWYKFGHFCYLQYHTDS